MTGEWVPRVDRVGGTAPRTRDERAALATGTPQPAERPADRAGAAARPVARTETVAMTRVLLVDDSVVTLQLVRRALATDTDIAVVGTARNGRIALAEVDRLRPDLVIMDVEMPELDGVATLRALRRDRPHLPVILYSSLTKAGARATLDALDGATDYVTKPTGSVSIEESVRGVRDQLVPRIHALTTGRTGGDPSPVPRRSLPAGLRHRVDVVAIGCSTGGPDALTRLLAGLPGNTPVPVLVVQHMPRVFTSLFAERLDGASTVIVREATDGVRLAAGTVYIAPGDEHLEVMRHDDHVIARLHHGAAENYCRPSVDVLFRSVAATYGRAALALVLTGMGHDGVAGCELLRSTGAEILVQDQATSVVWGMPGAVANAGLADAVLPLAGLTAMLPDRLWHNRPGPWRR